ncbi:MAG: hypothetical protein WCP21_09915 [Armatimonadota bacterium]
MKNTKPANSRQMLRLATLALLPTLAAAAPATMSVAREGKAVCAIAVAADATPAEQTAARELAVYLLRVTGARFIVGPPPATAGGAPIAVGPGAAKTLAPSLDLDRKALGEDGIVLSRAEDTLAIGSIDCTATVHVVAL